MIPGTIAALKGWRKRDFAPSAAVAGFLTFSIIRFVGARPSTVPKLCPRYAFVALLTCLAQRRINNLRAINMRLKNDPPSRHHKINYLQLNRIHGRSRLCPNCAQTRNSCFRHLIWTHLRRGSPGWHSSQIFNPTLENRKSTVDAWGLINRASPSQAAKPLQ
jgi:hypothetical protein